jgi:hypothetical protein
MELFRIVTGFYRRLKSPMLERQTQHELELENLSRVVCLPCREDTIRGYSDISILVIDEAARVPDDLYRAVRPMLAVSKGRQSSAAGRNHRAARLESRAKERARRIRALERPWCR